MEGKDGKADGHEDVLEEVQVEHAANPRPFEVQKCLRDWVLQELPHP